MSKESRFLCCGESEDAKATRLSMGFSERAVRRTPSPISDLESGITEPFNGSLRVQERLAHGLNIVSFDGPEASWTVEPFHRCKLWWRAPKTLEGYFNLLAMRELRLRPSVDFWGWGAGFLSYP